LKVKTFNPHSKQSPLHFESPNTIVSFEEGQRAVSEIACPTSCRIIRELESFAGISTQFYCYSRLELPTSKSNARRKGKPIESWFLNVIIYGIEELASVVGAFLTRHQKYLQDPLGCARNVVYQNPHLLSPDSDEVVMTCSFNSLPGNLEIERLEVGPDLLAQLMEDEIPLAETEAPPIVTATLFGHQKQALTFMLRREQGWAMDRDYRDVWTKEVDRAGRPIFINNVSGSSHSEAPEEFRGGLLADDMGLGKTLSMICLIAANQMESSLLSPPITPEPIGRTSYPIIKSTLLIVPPSLMQAWEKQFSLHIQPNTLMWRSFHGQNQSKVDSLGQYDVVITTYHTLAAIWRKSKDNVQVPESLFALTWHRVVLDEAHTIQNSQNQLSQACYAVRSPRRWAITGTPIQNKLTDFASIVRFLKVHPYSEQDHFDQEISRPWHQGDRQGFLKLKTLVRAITISRTKNVVQLPSRLDEVHHLDFSPAERWMYTAATNETRSLIAQATAPYAAGCTKFNALQRLNALRLICCHGLLTRLTQGQDRNATQSSQLGTQSSRYECILNPPCFFRSPVFLNPPCIEQY
jgi:SNF2 family DNA or RNA helicase